MPLISEIRVVQILEVVCKCLDDEVISVREMAATYVIFFWPLIALNRLPAPCLASCVALLDKPSSRSRLVDPQVPDRFLMIL